jgi:hypothetical protein
MASQTCVVTRVTEIFFLRAHTILADVQMNFESLNQIRVRVCLQGSGTAAIREDLGAFDAKL